MNKNDLINISKEIYLKKNNLKKLVKSGDLKKNITKYRVFIPKQFFDTSEEFQSDQWYFNGFILDLDGSLILVDPGVDFYTRFTATGLSANDIQTVIITHNHIDHTADTLVFLEKVLRNESKKITLYISDDAFKTKIPEYYQNKLKEAKHIIFHLLKDSGQVQEYKILDRYPAKFIPLYHSCPDTFGFKIDIDGKVFGYVTDTGYAIKVKTDLGNYDSDKTEGEFASIEEKHQYIKDFYSDVDIALVNINALEYNKHSKYHLSGWDLLDLFKDSLVKQVLLQHISPVNAEGEDSNYLYKLFFGDQPYHLILPHYLGRKLDL